MDYANKELVDNTDRIAEEITQEKHKNHHRDTFFPMMINKLDLKIGAEIGVDKAGFSNHILSKTKIDKYYCIDTWQDDFGSNYRPGYFDKDGNKRFNDAYEILKPYGNRVVMMQMTSGEACSKVNDQLDFVYIDGDHSLFGIYDDLHYWTPKVRIGGIVSGHDFKDGPKSGINDYFGKQLDYRIKTVTEDFCRKYGYKLNIVGGRILSWWFVKNI